MNKPFRVSHPRELRNCVCQLFETHLARAKSTLGLDPIGKVFMDQHDFPYLPLLILYRMGHRRYPTRSPRLAYLCGVIQNCRDRNGFTGERSMEIFGYPLRGQLGI
jgi:hypothetical protein